MRPRSALSHRLRDPTNDDIHHGHHPSTTHRQHQAHFPSSLDPQPRSKQKDGSPLWGYIGPGLVDGGEEGPDEGEDSKLDPEDGGVEDEGGDEGRGGRARRPREVRPAQKP